ncbi:MAG: MtrB/PioB family decaheme-associated outer membrane protein, partial [Acidiferrobacterales bacterium]
MIKKSFYMLIALLLVAQPVLADPENVYSDLTAEEIAVLTDPDLSAEEITELKKKWKCKYCPDASEEPWYLQIDTGLGYVSNDSYQFGQYNGLNKKGAFLVLNFDTQYRDGSGDYFKARGDRLGLDNRSLEMEGGRQGTYKIKLLYDQIYKYDEDTGRTPYSGGPIQSLPSGWVSAPDTSGFLTINESLRNADLYTQRKNFQLGATYNQSSRISYDLNFDRQAKEGRQSFGAAIGSNFAQARSAILAAPVDYVTDQVGLAANYKGNDFSGRLAVTNSSFRNANESLRWQNAYTEPAGPPPVTEGQAATDPDNDMQQAMLTVNYHGVDKLNLAGYFSYARMTQDQDFLPYTTNSALVTTPLPQTSLNGEIIANTATLKANWLFLPRTRLNVLYDYQEQVNNTKSNQYDYVIADTLLSPTSRINPAYSFRNQRFKLDVGHRFANKIKLEGGAKYATMDRTFQAVEKQKETGLWAAIGNSISA